MAIIGRLKTDLVDVCGGWNFVCGQVWPRNADVCLFVSRWFFVARIEGCENRDFDKFHFLGKNRRFYEMLIWSCSGPLNALLIGFSSFSGSIHPGTLVWGKFSKFCFLRFLKVLTHPKWSIWVNRLSPNCGKIAPFELKISDGARNSPSRPHVNFQLIHVHLKFSCSEKPLLQGPFHQIWVWSGRGTTVKFWVRKFPNSGHPLKIVFLGQIFLNSTMTALKTRFEQVWLS